MTTYAKHPCDQHGVGNPTTDINKAAIGAYRIRIAVGRIGAESHGHAVVSRLKHETNQQWIARLQNVANALR